MSTRPVPTIGFRRERRHDGSQHLVAVLTEDVALAAGSRLRLVHLHDGGGPGPEFSIIVQAPARTLTNEQRSAAVAADALPTVTFDTSTSHKSK